MFHLVFVTSCDLVLSGTLQNRLVSAVGYNNNNSNSISRADNRENI